MYRKGSKVGSQASATDAAKYYVATLYAVATSHHIRERKTPSTLQSAVRGRLGPKRILAFLRWVRFRHDREGGKHEASHKSARKAMEACPVQRGFLRHRAGGVVVCAKSRDGEHIGFWSKRRADIGVWGWSAKILDVMRACEGGR